MYISRRLLSFRQWNTESAEWLRTKWGRRARIGLLAGTIISYPIISLAVNGPLVNITFHNRYTVQDLPLHLDKIAKEEYERFLEKEARLPKDALVTEHINTNIADHDTVASGSLGVRTGLHLAVPFFAQFLTKDEVLRFFKERNMSYIDFLGERLPVDWDTPIGEELADTFVMSDGARRFLFLRDLYAHDGYAALAQGSISWSSWTTFSGIFTYWLHSSSKMFGQTALSFVGIYSVLLAAAWYCNRNWLYLYRYLADVHADGTSAKSSFEHSEGGKEFYWKELKRNRLIRGLHPNLYRKITLSGDIKGIPTSIFVRYDHLKDVKDEDDELKQVVGGDVF